MYRIGIDLGGTKIEGIVLDKNDKEIFRERVPTEAEKGYSHILQKIKKVVDKMAEKTESGNFTIGIGTPGSISPKTGLLRNSNTVCMNHMPVKQDIEKILEHPIGIQNDANCFAMAEALDGAGKGKDLVFGVIMGTGCGGGIIYKGQVLTGMNAIGGEWGHVSIDPNGPLCWCGAKGCIETFISGGRLEKQYLQQFGHNRKLKEIMENYRQGKENDIIFIRQFFKNFGRSLANLINILDPDIVVLGGGVSNIPELYTEGIQEIRKQVFSETFVTPIVKNELGDSAGVIGAALIGV
jgi:fructokinase